MTKTSRVLSAIAVVSSVGVSTAPAWATPHSFFTRRVQQLTGRPNTQGGVKGQDSALIIPYKDEVRFFFGDTLSAMPMASNSMASTQDFDASDGIDLKYSQVLPISVLKAVPPEATVWLTGPFVVGDDIYSYFLRIPAGWNTDGKVLGSGLAVLNQATGKFVRTSLDIPPETPLTGIGESQVVGDYVYSYVQKREGWTFYNTLVRAPVAELANIAAFEAWTGHGWSFDLTQAEWLFENSTSPNPEYNPYLGQWLAVTNNFWPDPAYGPSGLVSQIVLRTSDSRFGSWSDPSMILSLSHPTDPEKNYALAYNAFHSAAFDREGGRVFYTTATDWNIYNVYLYETQIDYAQTTLSVRSGSDDASQRGSGRARTKFERLPLMRLGRSMVGYQLRGSSFYPRQEVTKSTLTLPLAKPIASSHMDVVLRIELGVPDSSSFSGLVKKELTGATKIASIDVPVTLVSGDDFIVLDNEINELLDIASQDPAWDPGKETSIPLYISRVDSSSRTIQLAAIEEGMGAASLDVCYGACP